MKKFIGTKNIIRYVKGSSEIVSGIKQKDTPKLEKLGAIGGNGTYRVFSPSILEIVTNIENETHYIDIKIFLKKELNIERFTPKRVNILRETIPEQLDFIESKNKNKYFELDINGPFTKKWIESLKEKFK